MMTRTTQVYHFEVPPNERALLYDEAVNELNSSTEGVDMAQVQSLKFHTNTWGLSSCNSFADNVMSKMKKVEMIDFSDTVKYRHRSDLCMSTRAILAHASKKNVRVLNLNDNLLEEDGARAFVDFLKENKSLKVLKLSNCGLADKSCIMMLEAFESNPKLQLEELDISGNSFGLEGVEALAKIIGS